MKSLVIVFFFLLAGHSNIHVIDINDVSKPMVLFHTSYDNVDATDVEVCGGFVFVAFDNQTAREDGFVDVFTVFNSSSGSFEHVQRIVGEFREKQSHHGVAMMFTSSK